MRLNVYMFYNMLVFILTFVCLFKCFEWQVIVYSKSVLKYVYWTCGREFWMLKYFGPLWTTCVCVGKHHLVPYFGVFLYSESRQSCLNVVQVSCDSIVSDKV